MFCLSVAMCFGEKPDEQQIKEIQEIQYYILLLFTRFSVFSILPQVTKVVFCKKWNEIVRGRKRQAEILLSLMKSRKDKKLRDCQSQTEILLSLMKSRKDKKLRDCQSQAEILLSLMKSRKDKKLRDGGACEFLHTDSLLDIDIGRNCACEFLYSYADSLLDIDIVRKLTEDEIVNLCHEFISAGTDTTSTPLEWAMTELVKNPEIQRKLAEYIEMVKPKLNEEEIKEEDLQKMPYLKAVIMEVLRLHPPGHFLLPHRVAEDVELNGYLIPKDAEVLFNVMQLGLDEKVWQDPMKFRPERFLGHDEVVDLTGSREIKMMPFGVGRRMCPGYGLGMLHLEYFVANLVREFEWRSVDGEEVDMSEKFEFTTMMKNLLHARIIPRRNK